MRRAARLHESKGAAADNLSPLAQRYRVRTLVEVDERVQVRLGAQAGQQPVTQRFELTKLLYLRARALHGHRRSAARRRSTAGALRVVQAKCILREHTAGVGSIGAPLVRMVIRWHKVLCGRQVHPLIGGEPLEGTRWRWRSGRRGQDDTNVRD